MTFTRKSTAWLLAGLQLGLAVAFAVCLDPVAHHGLSDLSQTPSWYGALLFLHFGLFAVLALCALWSFEAAGLALLLAIHTVCPLLFFTDLTRNPYYTQIALLNIWVAFLWIAWLWESLQNGKFAIPRTALDLPLVCFLGVAALSWGCSFLTHPASFYAAMVAEGHKNVLFLILNVIAVFYLGVAVRDPWRRRFVWITFLVGCSASLYGLMQFYGIESIWNKTLTPFANRPVSTFGNPNFLSSYLLLLVPLSLTTLLLAERSSVAAASFAIFLILVAGIVATMTRSTWVGTLVIFALLPLARPVRRCIARNRRRIAIAAAALALGVLFWPRSRLGGYANPWQRVVEIETIKTAGSYGPWHQRVLIWCSCWLMAKDHPIIGKGWGLLELFYPYYQGKMLFNPLLRNFRTHANNAHNEVLEVWSQTGFLGMGLYAWLWVVLVIFGIKCAREFEESAPDKALWCWALTAGSLGMLADNFFGNVSIHFAVPAFLFWWQAGLTFSWSRSEGGSAKTTVLHPAEWRLWPVENNLHKLWVYAALVFLSLSCVLNFAREFQEIHYFSGFKFSKGTNDIDRARQELESAWLWYPREVNSNYEMANAYARLSQQAGQMGLAADAEQWRKKALWGYLESLRSNCGYDEIYFNLGATLAQMNRLEDGAPDVSLTNPRGVAVVESAQEMGGAVYNYSRALAINPLSDEAYNFLGNVYLQHRDRYGAQGLELFRRATEFFPKKKDFWVNLGYLQIQSKDFQGAYASLKTALALDPFYELTLKNLHSLLLQTGRKDDPLAQVEQDLPKINPLVQSKNWPALLAVAERTTNALPDCFQMRLLLANVDYELRRWTDAEREYGRAAALEPANPTPLLNLSLVYRATGRLAEAKKLYEKILEIDPNNAPAKEALKAVAG